MSSRLSRNCLVTVLAVTALATGTVFASGLVNVQISPDQGPAGTTVAVSATGFRDMGKREFATPTYWAEISIGDNKVATNVPVAADLSVKQGIVVNAPPGDQRIVVMMYARDSQGTRYIDSGERDFRVYDPGPARPLSVSMHVTAPERTLSGNDVILNVTLQSGAGDRTKVGLYAGVYDQSNKLKQSLTFAAAPPAQGLVADRIEMMDPNRTEQFASGPFSLPAGTWRIHFTLLVNNVAQDMDRTIIVGAAPPDPTPKKPPPHLAPGAPSR
jgi:hypothetical protein